mgnify:FL=1
MKARLLLLTFLGGAIGSVLRYAISLGLSLPIWLWVVNLLGALVLGFVQVNKRFSSAETQSLIATGFAGGFTTLSSLITFGMLGNDPNFFYLAQQIGAGVAVYWLGRILGGERSWPNTW